HGCVSKRVLNSDAGGTGKDEPLPGAAIAKQGVIGGVLDQHPAEVGLGSKIAGGNTAFDGGIAAACAFQIVIAPVANVEKVRRSYPGGRGEKRNEVGGDLNIGGFHAAITETVGKRRQFAVLFLVQHLQDLESLLQAFRGKGRNVHRLVVKPSGSETKFVFVQQLGNVEANQPSLLQLADVALHGEGLMAPAHVDTADAQRHAGTDAGLAQRSVGSGRGLPGLELETDAVIEGISLRLARCDQHVLARFGTLRVLDGRVHLLEEAKVVESPLALQHVLLAQGGARLHPHFPAGDSGTGVVQTIEKKLIDKKLLALVNRESHTNS